MNFRNRIKLLAGAGMLCLFLQSFDVKHPYQNTSLSPEERAEDLVGRLTLAEKVSLMQNASPAIPRLGIKAYDWWNEALHGVARAGVATVFPQPIGMAASFDDALLYDVFTAVSDEARAKHNKADKSGELKRYQGLTYWTPNVNILRDPRWGRGHETYGEDPYLSSRMGISVVRGLQGPSNEKYDKLHACAKHYAVHSGPEWCRHSFNAENISQRDLWETYLPAFKALVQKADVKEVMCAYTRFEGEPCCGSGRLLQQILRDEWGFEGIVLTDCWAINNFFGKNGHNTEPDAEHASAKAVMTGTDLECGQTYGSLVEAVKNGLIKEATIDRSLKRLLKARFELGEMDSDVFWTKIPYSVVDSKEHRALALKMAQESLVLLQNRDGLLPLSKHLKVAVIGPNANDSIMQWGNYNGFPSQTSTLLKGIQHYLSDAQVIYDFGCDHTSSVSIQSLFQQCSINGKQGFTASYWNNKAFPDNSTPDVTEHVNTPFHFTTAGATVFAPNVDLGGFSARYESVFHPTKSEEVVFGFQTQGHATLFVNGERATMALNMKSNRAYAMQVEAGKEYKLRIDFGASEGDCATLNFDFGREVPLNLVNTIEKAKEADIIIFAGGISPQLEGEEMPVAVPGFKGGDRENIDLPDVQVTLLTELKKIGKKIVFVNFSGGSMALTHESNMCDAILQAWYPGQAGGDAIASVLFGEYNPAGRLPITFYRSIDQFPDFLDYSMKGRTYRYMTDTPLFPFGHGLSYTDFTYGNARLSSTEMTKDKVLTITIPVSNIGKCDGEEVVQVYLRRPGDTEGPSHSLRGFQRVAIKKGETQQVELQLKAEDFEWFDTATNTMRPIEGEYEILYGGTSDMKMLKTVKVGFTNPTSIL